MNKKILLVSVAVIAVVAVVAVVGIKQGFFKNEPAVDEGEQVDESARFGYEALKINGTYVTADRFNEEYLLFYEKYKSNGEMLQKTDEERYDILIEQMIEKIVLEDYFANQTDVKVTDSEIDNYVEKYVAPRYSNSEEQTAYFETMGFSSEEDMRNNISNYLIKQEIYFKAAQSYNITLTDEERSEAYETHKIHNRKIDIKNILIAINDSRTEQQAKELANEVYSKLKEGANFEELVEQYSDDTATKENGGKKENVSPGYNETDYDDAVFAAEEGQLLEPIQLAKGYDIVFIEKIRDFTHPEDEYAEIVLVEKFINADEYDQWLAEIKKDYEIEITGAEFKAFRAYTDEKYDEAGALYELAYEQRDSLTYIDRACDSYDLAENWESLVRVSQIGYKERDDNILYYIYEAKGIYKGGNEKDGLKKMKAAYDKSEDNVYYLSVLKSTYEELGLTEEAEKINLE